jgi:hypothetical protein
LDPRFEYMPFEDKVDYIIKNRDSLPNDLVDRAINILVQAGEIEHSATLAMDRGLINRAIEILVEAGDYLWAALMAKNAGMEEDAKRLYTQGLGFYIDRREYGRAVAAAQALNLPMDEIAAIFYKGVETESQYFDAEHAQALIDQLGPELQIALTCRGIQTPDEALESLAEYSAKDMQGEDVEWPAGAEAHTTGRGRIEEQRPSWAHMSQMTGPGQAMSPEGIVFAATGPAAGGFEGPSRWRGGSYRGMRSPEGLGAPGNQGQQSYQGKGSVKWTRSGRSR